MVMRKKKVMKISEGTPSTKKETVIVIQAAATAIHTTPHQLIKVIFDNPADRFSEMGATETVNKNEILLLNLYNDVDGQDTTPRDFSHEGEGLGKLTVG